jgi:CubicO group peptidase (beta-lactamase class C family)
MAKWQIFPYETKEFEPAMLDGLRAEGYRPISLGIYTPYSPLNAFIPFRYCAVFAQRAEVHWRDYHVSEPLPVVDAIKFYAEHYANYRPTIVSAAGTENDIRFVLVLVRRAQTFFTLAKTRLRFEMRSGGIRDPDTFEYWNAKAHAEGMILTWATMYGAPPRFAAIWDGNPKRVRWDYSFQDPVGEHQRVVDAYTEAGLRPSLVTLSDRDGRYLSIWRDDKVSADSFTRHHMTKEQLDAETLGAWNAGYRPLHIQAGSGSDSPVPLPTRYAATYAHKPKLTTTRKRKWIVTGWPNANDGPFAQAQFAPFDNYIKSMMREGAIRSASLAIVKDDNLVYAKGFTWAEVGYTITLPTTRFLCGSFSKMVSSFAVFRVLQNTFIGPTLIYTPFLNYTPLTTFAGEPPGSNQLPISLSPVPDQVQAWQDVTLSHLLRHLSGLPVAGAWADDNVVTQHYNWYLSSQAPFLAAAPVPLPREVYWQNVANSPSALAYWPGTHFEYAQGFYFVQFALETLIHGYYPGFYLDTVSIGEDATTYSRTYERFVQDQVWGPIGVTRAAIARSYFSPPEPGVDYPTWEEAPREAGHGLDARDPDIDDPQTLDPPLPSDGLFYVGPRWMLRKHALFRGRLAVATHGTNVRPHEVHGGWAIAPADAARLLSGFNSPVHPLLTWDSQYAMLQLWNDFDSATVDTAMHGIYYTPLMTSANTYMTLSHGGGVSGGVCVNYWRSDNVTMVLMFNRDVLLQRNLWFDLGNLLDQVNPWPTWDFFSRVGIGNTPFSQDIDWSGPTP